MQLMKHIAGHLLVIKAVEVVMNGDPLAQGFMNRFAEDIIQMGLPAEDECETVQGIISVIHQHPDIVKDAGAEELCLINSDNQRLPFVSVQVKDLLLNCPEHAGLSSFVTDSENFAELFVKFRHAHGGKTDVFHAVKAAVQFRCETAERIGLSHAGCGRKDADSADIFKIIESGEHLIKVIGTKTVSFFDLLFVKRVEGHPVIRSWLHSESPAFA